MLFELLTTFSAGLLVATSVTLLVKVVTDRWALMRTKKTTRGLPILPGANLIGNHTLSFAVGKQNCEVLRRCHEEMGSTLCALRGSTLLVSTTDLDLIKTFIMDEPNSHLDRCPAHLPLEEYEKSIMLAPSEEWRQLRKAIAPALAPSKFKTPNVIAEVEASINNLIGLIERQLDALGETHLFNWDQMAHKYSLDVVFRCLYKQYELIDFDNPHDSWTKSMDSNLEIVQKSLILKVALVFPVLRRALDWLIWNFHPEGETRKKIFSFVKSQAVLSLEAKKQFRQLESEAERAGVKLDPTNFTLKDGRQFRRNMIDHVIDQFHEGKISKSQYMNSGCFLLGAADKTACDCITHTIYLLASNQRIQDETRRSIRADGAESEYLDWVLKESLRLMPPAPIGCSRRVTRDFELEGGFMVPAGAMVITCAYIIHRLKKYWGDDANEFRPERWSDTTQHHPLQYIPFGAGIRGCPGKHFAMFEMKMLLAALLTRYQFECEARDDAYAFDSPFMIFVLPHSETRVKIRRIASG